MSSQCQGCRQDFIPLLNVPSQKFCRKKKCQRKRRAQWQRQKLSADPHYREYQQKAKSNWREQHRDYMRKYRKNHPEYRERERQQRRERRMRAAGGGAATDVQGAVNMDVCTSKPAATPIESGYFRVCRVMSDNAVKMGECYCGTLVQLVVVKEDRTYAPVHGGAP